MRKKGLAFWLESLESRVLLTAAAASVAEVSYAATSSTTVIDLLALYTPQELAAEGSVQAVLNKINQQVADVNKAFTNSQISVTIRLAAAMLENYTEAGDLATDWTHLSNTTDGVMDDVVARRKQVGADLVVLLDAAASPGSSANMETYGEGSILDSSMYGAKNQDTAAYMVVAEEVPVSDHVLAHEIGHTLGAAHAMGDPQPTGLTDDSHGYRFTGKDGTQYRDIMAYDPGTVIPYFSNPNVKYQGVATGDTTSANSARVINMTAASVAAYRSAGPFGAITAASTKSISGWAIDSKALTTSLTITLNIDGTNTQTMVAGDGNSDLLGQYGASNHGFTYALPYMSPGLHVVKVYAKDTSSGTSVLVATASVNSTRRLILDMPTIGTAGTIIGPINVSVTDSAGRPATDYLGMLTMTIDSGPAGATIGGSPHALLVNGVANFSDVALPKAGTYTLKVSDGVLTTTSARLTVTADAGSSRLVLLSGATAGLEAGEKLSPVIIGIVDQYGNAVTSNHSKIVLTVASGPADGAFKGTTSVTAANGKATFSGVSLSQAGQYTLSAAPAEGATVVVKDAKQWQQTVLQASTSIGNATVKAGGYAYGTSITLGGTLKSSVTLAGAFNGAVMLTLDGGQAIAGSVTTTGAVKFIVAGLTAGTHTAAVVYAGDVNHTAATGSTFTFTVNQAASKTTLTAGSAVVYGEPVLLTANVKWAGGAGSPTDTVTFWDGGMAVGTATLTGGKAAVAVNLPTVGTHVFTASFSGDENVKASTSAKKKVTVKKDNMVVTLTLPPGERVAGEAFDMQAAVSAVAPGTAVATGLVTFKDGGRIMGTAALDETGHATLSGSVLTAGKHTLTVSYAGDANCNAKVSATVRLVASTAATTLAGVLELAVS